MNYLVIIICGLLFLSTGANASELIGKISTDPQVLADIVNGTGSGQNNISQNNSMSGSTSGGADTASVSQTPELENSYRTIYSIAGKKGARQIKILGISLYPNNSLLRDASHRIYLVKNGFKKRILSLSELRKYHGQSIYDVTAEELAYYQAREHLDGELIKEKGKQEVYVLVNGKRRLISGPAELKNDYRGLEIFSISPEEMGQYR